MRDVVLCAQLADWKRFRSFQGKIRRYYRRRPFCEFVTKAHNRREKHDLGGTVGLLFDVNQQTRLENWMEFQNYHLQFKEHLERERDGWKKEVEDTSSGVSDRIAGFKQPRLEHAERNLFQHEKLLQWTEEERTAMDISYTMLTKDDIDSGDALPNVIPATRAGGLRKRQVETPTVLGDVKISKTKSKQRTGHLRKCTTSGPGSTVEDSAVAP